MKLYILRHGAAEAAAAAGDGARKLSPAGRDRIRKEAAGMRALGLEFDAILTSPLTRAVETAEIVAQAYGGHPAPQVVAALSAGLSPVESVGALKPFARNKSVLVVGHEPGLSQVASLLLTGSQNSLRLDLKKGALAALDLDERLDRGSGNGLCWLLAPRQLRRLRR